MHEQVEEELSDRREEGANRSVEGITIQPAEGVTTRSHAPNISMIRSQTGAPSHRGKDYGIQRDKQTTTRPGKEVMARSSRAGTSSRPGSSSLRIRENVGDQFDPYVPATEGDLSRVIDMWDKLLDELAAQKQESSVLRQKLTAMDRRVDDLIRQRVSSPTRLSSPEHTSSSEEPRRTNDGPH